MHDITHLGLFDIAMIEQMNACIRNGEQPHITEEFSRRNMRLLDRILDAAGYTDFRREFILQNGVSIPAVGFGSYLSTQNGTQTITDALRAGYRYIDTAKFYDIFIFQDADRKITE